METVTIAQLLARRLAEHGVERMFGIPGGGSSPSIIGAAARVGIEFVLARSENSAVIMAAVDADLRGGLGVALATKGPGVSNAANGLVHALLDRSPVVFICDGFVPEERTYVTHQVFDQAGMMSCVSKKHTNLAADPEGEIEASINRALAAPQGPVCIEVNGETARARLTTAAPDVTTVAPGCANPQAGVDRAISLLKSARRPIIIVGLEAREPRAANALRRFADVLKCPVLTTYKAKGIVTGDRFAGIFTGGTAESHCIRGADLILFCGLDPVEMIRKRWTYEAPVLDIGTIPHEPHYVTPSQGVYGDLASNLHALTSGASASAWSDAEIATMYRDMVSSMSYSGHQGLGPQQVVQIVAEQASKLRSLPRISVDAGAHMLSAVGFWPSAKENDVLISNGLATMGFAVPAGIAAALHDPSRGAIAFTGDGGLLMCLGELSIAVENRLRLVIMVFNDAALSLIDIKPHEAPLPRSSVTWRRPNFAAIMQGLGGTGFQVSTEEELRKAMAAANAVGGPVLIDALIDGCGYRRQLNAIRG